MLRIFPKPYPDEFLYSIFVRYHIRSGNRSFTQSINDLLGYAPQQLYGLDLPSNLGNLIKQLELVSNQTVETLISNHTLYCFYKSFLTPPEAFLLKDLMRKKTNKPIFQVARIPASEKNGNKRVLKFCPQCFEEDLQKYGEAYWHRSHQIPGVLVCLTHEMILQRSLVLLQEGYLDCHAADIKNCPLRDDKTAYREDTIQRILAIAQDITWLSNSNFDFKGLQWLRNRYQHYLSEQGFVYITPSKNIKFDKQKFADAIFGFYGQEFWAVVSSNPQTQAANYFAHCLFACDVAPVIDRTMHIVLIRFLSNSLKEFFEG